MRRRLVPASVAATLVAVALTGCTAAGNAAACENPLKPGPLSNSVSLNGSTVSVTGPTDVLNAQRTVLVDGDRDGRVTQPGDIVTANVTFVDAASGQVLNQRENAPHLALPEALVGEIDAALATEQAQGLTLDHLIATAFVCASAGDTVVVGATAEQTMASQLGMGASVAVIEVLDVAAPTASGETRGLPAGFPAVATDATGRPGIVLPPQAAPSALKVAVRVQGTGEKITPQDSVIGQNLTVSWAGSVVENTWETGVTVFGSVEQPNPAYSYRELLNGHPVGTQLVILDPADGNPVVHVVDVVAAS